MYSTGSLLNRVLLHRLEEDNNTTTQAKLETLNLVEMKNRKEIKKSCLSHSRPLKCHLHQKWSIWNLKSKKRQMLKEKKDRGKKKEEEGSNDGNLL